MGFSNDRIINAKKLSGVVSNRNYADALAGFENGLNNLIGYSDGTTRPTGVFGGSATNLTKTSNATNPIENNISLKIARTAAAQGQGYYFDFVPSRNDKLSAATLNIKFFHELVSGTFSGSVNPSVDSDLIIGVWDIANNKNIEPKNRLIEPMVSNYVYRYSSNFQIPINATTLRVYIHCATTNSAAFELNLDALEISTINVVNATIRPPVGSIIAHSSTTPPDGYLYCNGQTVSRTQYAKLFSVVDTKYGQGDGSTTFHVPDLRGRFLRGVNNGSGVDPDAASRTAMNTGGATGDNVGSVQTDTFTSHSHGGATPVGGAHRHRIITPNDYLRRDTVGGLGGYVVNPAGVNNGGSRIFADDQNDGIDNPNHQHTINADGGNETRPENANVAYMICYDDGNVQLGNIYDSAKLSARVQTASQSITVATQNQITFNSSNANINDAGMVETNQVRIKTTDEYDIIFRAQSQIANASEYVALFYKINSGSTVLFGQAVGNTGTYCQPQAVEKLQLNAGDILTFYVQTGIGTTIFTPTIIVTKKDKQKIIGQNNNSAACKYVTTSGQTFSGVEQRVNFNTLKYDIKGSVVTGASWEFTTEESGIYETKASLTRAVLAEDADFECKVYYDGVLIEDSYVYRQLVSGSTQLIQAKINTEDYLLAGKKIYISVRDPSGGSLTPNAYENWISIKKVR